MEEPAVSAKTEHFGYPNPVENILLVRVPETVGEPEILLMNLYGETVCKEKISSGEQEKTLNVSNLPAGMYFLKSGNHIEKIVKR